MDVRDYDLKALRDKIGYVPQQSFLFKGTVKSNSESPFMIVLISGIMTLIARFVNSCVFVSAAFASSNFDSW